MAFVLLPFYIYIYIEQNSKTEKRQDWLFSLAALLLSLLYMVGLSCRNNCGILFFTAGTLQALLALCCFVGHAMLFRLLLQLGFLFIQQFPSHELAMRSSSRKTWLMCFVILLLFRLPWLTLQYPAPLCPDSLIQLQQYFGIRPWTGHYPPLSTGLMGLCVSLGSWIFDPNLGVFLYVLLQTITGAAVFSYAMLQIRRFGCGCVLTAVSFLFYALMPFWGFYSQWFEKDFLYAQLFLLTLLLCLDILRSRRCSWKKAICLCVSMSLACLSRNNAVYELVPIAMLLPFFLVGSEKKRMVLTSCTVFLLVWGTNSLLYPALKIEKGSVREMLSIPFQQTARYVQEYPDDLTEEQIAAIDAVLDFKSLSDVYLPTISDPVKNSYHGDCASLMQYFKHWFVMGWKHPDVYIDAFLYQSYGYLAPVSKDGISVDYYPGNSQELKDLGIELSFHMVPSALARYYTTLFTEFPLTWYFFSPGFYSWLVMICAVYFFAQKRYSHLLLLLPLFVNILCCVASPLHGSIRYCLSTISFAPVILAVTLAKPNPNPCNQTLHSEPKHE